MLFKVSILAMLAIGGVCLMAGQTSAFDLAQCVKDMEAAFEDMEIPKPVEDMLEIIRLANDNKKLLMLDDIGDFAKRQLKQRGEPVECKAFNQEVRDRMAKVECSAFIRMDLKEDRIAVANSRLDQFLGAIGACTVSGASDDI